LLKTNKAADDKFRDNFEKTADEYEDEYKAIRSYYKINVSALRVCDSSSFITRNFHLISRCMQQYFSYRTDNPGSSKAELRNIACDLQTDNGTSFVTNAYKKYCFNYSAVVKGKITILRQTFDKEVELIEAIQSQVENDVKYLCKEISDTDTRFTCKVVPIVIYSGRDLLSFRYPDRR